MDFEVLHLPVMSQGPFESLRRYLANPSRMMQAWGEKAPNFTGFLVLGLASIELAFARRLLSGVGAGPSLVSEAIAFGGLIVFAQVILLTAGSSVANVMEKKGHPLAALCYMNMGLAPLLLVLPVAFIFHAMDVSGFLSMLLLLLIVWRVAANWREAIQFSFRLSRLQTVVAFYGAGSATLAIAVILLYITVVGRVLSVVS